MPTADAGLFPIQVLRGEGSQEGSSATSPRHGTMSRTAVNETGPQVKQVFAPLANRL